MHSHQYKLAIMTIQKAFSALTHITTFRALFFDQNNNNQDGRAGFKGFLLFANYVTRQTYLTGLYCVARFVAYGDSGMHNANKKLDRKLNGYCKTFKR